MNKSNSCYINGKIKSKISRRIFPKTHKKVQLITDGTLKYQIYCCSDSAKKKKTKLNSYVYLKNEKKNVSLENGYDEVTYDSTYNFKKNTK